MSVDTYLKGKVTTGYRLVRRDGVKILLSPKLAQWGTDVRIDVKKRVLRGSDFTVDVAHEHGPECHH